MSFPYPYLEFTSMKSFKIVGVIFSDKYLTVGKNLNNYFQTLCIVIFSMYAVWKFLNIHTLFNNKCGEILNFR